MIIGIDVEPFEEEIFQVKIDSDQKKVRSSPLQELTNEYFIKRTVSEKDFLGLNTKVVDDDLVSVILTYSQK